MGHGLGGLLGHVGFRKGAQRDQNLGAGFAQNARDLLGIQQRVDRIDDSGGRPRQQHDRGFDAVGQQIGHRIGRADAQLAQQVGGLGDAFQQFAPGQGRRVIRRPGQKLEADRGPVGKAFGGAGQKAMDRDGQVPRLIRHFRFQGVAVVIAAKTRHPSPPHGITLLIPFDAQNGASAGKGARALTRGRNRTRRQDAFDAASRHHSCGIRSVWPG